MASVKQFLEEVMLFAVALLGVGGEGMLSSCEAQSKQQQMKNVLNGGKGKIKFLLSPNFQLLSVRKNMGGG